MGGNSEQAVEKKEEKKHNPQQVQVSRPAKVVGPRAQEKQVGVESHRSEVKGNDVRSESNANRTFSVSLMEICRLDTPLVKRVPNSQRSAFATVWGKLLNEAVFSKQLGAWAEFFSFPKCILWTPARRGKRLAKKASFADIVRARLKRWPTDKEGLWKEVVTRSKAPAHQAPEAKPAANKDTEKAVLSALRLGDVRKALQLLNSAPIAPKTDATLKCLRKLHPAAISFVYSGSDS